MARPTARRWRQRRAVLDVVGHVVTQSRVDGTPALLSMWPIALATADGRSATAWRPPALVRGSLCREASSPFHVVRQTYSYELLSSYSHSAGRTRRGVPFLTGQKGDGKSRRAVRATADGSAPRRGRESELARTSAMASLRHRFAKSPSAGQSRPRRRTAKGPEEESVERRRDGGKIRPYIHPSCIHPSHIHPSDVHTRTEHAEFVSRVIGHGSCVIDVRSAPSFLLPERQKPVGRGTNGRSTLIPVAPYH
jgi:hypothetical protein